MKAQEAGARRTGRAPLALAYLATQTEARSAREVMDAIEPEGDITLMCATLNGLYRGNHVMREGTGFRGVRWRIAPANGRRAKPTAPAPAPAPISLPRGIANAPPPAPRTPSTAQPPRCATAKAPRVRLPAGNASALAIRCANAPEQRTNFAAAPGTVTSTPPGKLSASDRIALDIVAFEKGGGRVERLGITQIFRNPTPND